MALSVRASASVKAGAARKVQPRAAARTVRPVAALSQAQAAKVAGAGLASLAVAATFAAAPVSGSSCYNQSYAV